MSVGCIRVCMRVCSDCVANITLHTYFVDFFGEETFYFLLLFFCGLVVGDLVCVHVVCLLTCTDVTANVLKNLFCFNR